MPERLPIHGTDLAYGDDGAGPALVLIHGLGSSACDWEDQVGAFSASHRLLRPDLRGHGESRQAPGPYTIEQFARDVEALLDALCVREAAVVGLSMGGAVAVELAARAPERVRALVLVNTLPHMRARGFSERLKVLERLLLVQTCSMTKLGKILVRRVLPDPAHEPLRRRLLGRFAQNRKSVYQASLRSLLEWSGVDHLPRIPARTLVVASELDYTPVAAKQVFVDHMPDATLTVASGARHTLPQEQPAVFNRLVLDFLGNA